MPAAPPEHLTLTLPDGRQQGVLRFGNPGHRAVLYSHGFGTSGLAIPPDTALLQRLGLQILAPDRPGVGASDVDPGLSFQSVAADAMFAVDALGVQGPVAVLGWSVGGVHAMALAARYPVRVGTLHLLGTCLPMGEEHSFEQLSAIWKTLWWTCTQMPGITEALCRWLSRRWHRAPDDTIDWFIRLMWQAEQDVSEQPENRALLRDGAVRGFAHQGWGVFHDLQLWCRPPDFDLSLIQAPATLWHGLADGVWAPDNIPYLASRLPGGSTRLLPGEGHMLHLRHWEEILTAIRRELPD
ncbi:alpha/beta hydrolase [Hymenobacter saemangeumensis]|uniref:Alpha/beta hydrolase n=1 Tax=Hymenobacter saemangeumensis TaxID=1084522 RepID=A0ABP8IJV7_9BACT